MAEGLLHWVSIELNDAQTKRINELEKLAACPILTCNTSSNSSNILNNGKETDESLHENQINTQKQTNDMSLRQWYIHCANDKPVELPLIKKTVAKV